MDFLIIEESIIYIPPQGMCPAQLIADDKVIFNGTSRYRIQQFQNYLKLSHIDQYRRPPLHYYGNITIQNNRGDLIGKYSTEMANSTRYTQISGEYDIESIKFIRNYGHMFLQVEDVLYLYVGDIGLIAFSVVALDEETQEEKVRYVTAQSNQDDYMLLKGSDDDDRRTNDWIDRFFENKNDHVITTIHKIVLPQPYGEMGTYGSRRTRDLKPLKITEIFGEFIPVDSIDIT